MAGEKRIKVSDYQVTSDPDGFRAFGVRDNGDGTFSNMLLVMAQDAYQAYLDSTVEESPLTREEWATVYMTKADHGYSANEQKKTLREVDSKMITMTQAEFDAIIAKDEDKYYFIIED